MPEVDFGYFLNRKYAIQQQQADAATQQANTQQMVGAAQAGLDKTRTTLLPGESAASIALQKAQTGLVGEQAKVVAPTAAAQNALTGAQTKLTLTQNQGAQRELTPFEKLFGPIKPPSLTGGGFSLGQIVPPSTPQPAYGSAAWLDRQNGF